MDKGRSYYWVGFVPALGATNPHELMNALEVQDIFELSRLHTQVSLLRKESCNIPNHYRLDYPEQDNVKDNPNL